MQKKILFAAIFALAAFAGQAQQKKAEVSVPVNKSKVKAGPAAKFKKKTRKTTSAGTAVFTPPTVVRTQTAPAKKD